MTRPRILGIVWIVASVPVGFLGLLVVGLAGVVEGVAGVVMLVLAGLAGFVGSALTRAAPDRRSQRASLAVSVLWIAGSVVTNLSFDFAVDRWLFGAPLAGIGVLTAVLAAYRRAEDPQREPTDRRDHGR